MLEMAHLLSQTDPQSADGGESTSRTLRRGLAVLDAVLDSAESGLRLVDLCRITGLQRPTVSRLLPPLLEAGYLRREGRFMYAAGPRLAAPARRVSQPNLAVRLQPVLDIICSACGDSAFLVVRDRGQSNCIARQVGTHPTQILMIQVGTMQPLGVGAAGLALLAALPDDEVTHILRENEPLLADYGGMTPQKMNQLVRATRERGWSLVGNHAIQGVLGVGRAVLDAAGMPVAGISVASTSQRMTREHQRFVAKVIDDALRRRFPRGLL